MAYDDQRVRDYTALSLTDVGMGLANIARETQTTFGGFDGRQLNWRPDSVQWSVAQCFEHLFTANDLMFRAMESACISRREVSCRAYQSFLAFSDEC